MYRELLQDPEGITQVRASWLDYRQLYFPHVDNVPDSECTNYSIVESMKYFVNEIQLFCMSGY